MNNLLHRDSDYQEEAEDRSAGRGDREITLGTTMILAIFFALAVFAAIFFGFGYSMGSKRTAPSTLPVAAASASGSVFSTAKPGAGSPVASADAKQSTHDLEPAEQLSPTPPSPSAAKRAQATNVSSAPALPAALQPVVQIAAVSHQEDANLLVSTLKRRGYAVAVHTDPHDKLLHVQVGPFPTRQDAEAMRQRLIADGFNALVKEPSR